MKYVIKRSEAVLLEENSASKFREYQFPFNNASVGVSEINGRYPEKGYDIDEKVEQTWYVESGNGAIWIHGVDRLVEPGDMIFIPQGEKYFILGKNLTLVVTSSPPWTADQHKHRED